MDPEILKRGGGGGGITGSSEGQKYVVFYQEAHHVT